MEVILGYLLYGSNFRNRQDIILWVIICGNTSRINKNSVLELLYGFPLGGMRSRINICGYLLYGIITCSSPASLKPSTDTETWVPAHMFLALSWRCQRWSQGQRRVMMRTCPMGGIPLATPYCHWPMVVRKRRRHQRHALIRDYQRHGAKPATPATTPWHERFLFNTMKRQFACSKLWSPNMIIKLNFMGPSCVKCFAMEWAYLDELLFNVVNNK